MKLLIDIPDNDYRFIKDIYQIGGGRMVAKGTQEHVINAIKNGTPCDCGYHKKEAEEND